MGARLRAEQTALLLDYIGRFDTLLNIIKLRLIYIDPWWNDIRIARNMSKIHFLSDPFPDNHNGFDYSPKSVSDVLREQSQEVKAANDSAAQNKMMSLIASIFK